MPTRWRMPAESSLGLLVEGVAQTHQREVVLDDLPALAAGQVGEDLGTPSMTFSEAVIQGSRQGDWKTTPRSGPGSATSRPSSSTPPRVAADSPAAIERTVDLPQPECPMRQTNSPLAMVRSKSSTTGGAWPPPTEALAEPGELQVPRVGCGIPGAALAGWRPFLADGGEAFPRGPHAAASAAGGAAGAARSAARPWRLPGPSR